MMAPFTVCAPDSRGTSAATSNKTITGNDRLDIGNSFWERRTNQAELHSAISERAGLRRNSCPF